MSKFRYFLSHLCLPFIFTVATTSNFLAQENHMNICEILFEEVQMKGIFPDSKTFVDAIPKTSLQKIREQYKETKMRDDFDLLQFVETHFEIPQVKSATYKTPENIEIKTHLDTLWQVLNRPADEKNSSTLIPLPHPYIVPGGRFREIYYWDSYFTMLGLQTAGKIDLIENMLDNFAHLIEEVGHIPNGNRDYYRSRSQPPFFAAMVQLLAEEKGDEILVKYLPSLEKEYAFWMDGTAKLNDENIGHRRVIRVSDNIILNRYWDNLENPRPESYREDVELAKTSERPPEAVYKDIRAAAESGWDFSTRWFADGQNLSTIQTTSILPVDLNCLIYNLEKTLSAAYQLSGQKQKAKLLKQKAKQRKKTIHTLFWDEKQLFYTDYQFKEKKLLKNHSLAAMSTLFFKVATKKQAKLVAQKLEQDFLKPGGLLSTLVESGQQWDAPNGWAPLQWMAYKGLKNYRINHLAAKVRKRWIESNLRVFNDTGRLVEKYNVSNTKLEAGGGEYNLQDGFGWTNGVLQKMLSED